MEILHIDDGKHGKFYVEVNGKQEAEMTYVWAGTDKIIIDHTEVSDVLKGQSVGKQLVMKAVALAREKHFKILPLCPFAASVFEKDATIKDVL